MPRFFSPLSETNDSGKVVIESHSPDDAEVFYVPSENRLEQSDLESDGAGGPRARLLCVDGRNHSLTMFPTNTFSSSSEPDSFLQPKYSQIKRITIAEWRNFKSDVADIIFKAEKDLRIPEDEVYTLDDDDRVMMVLESLPSCFVKDYDYGLGFTQPYRYIVQSVEDLSDCEEIVVSETNSTGIGENGKVFYISTNDLDKLRKAINRTITTSQTAARSINYAATRNFFAEIIGQPAVPVRAGRSPIRKSITEAVRRGEASLSEDEQEDLLGVLEKHTKSFLASKPNKLASLKRDIELVTLDTLIDRFQEMMKADLKEREWQDFLDANSFILSLAFGYPVVKVRGQAWVGGHKLSGKGGTIADFLVKNSMTNNSAIIEIKTPQTDLLSKSPYRREVYPPSGELVGAINQALGQKQNFEREISLIKDKSGLPDIESYSVRCCLIIGKMPMGAAKKRSFELFRGNSRNVDIVTFDELFEKLKSLKHLLTSGGSDAPSQPQEVEPPF